MKSNINYIFLDLPPLALSCPSPKACSRISRCKNRQENNRTNT